MQEFRLYGVRAEDALFTIDDAALAFKATLPRLVPAGDIGGTDVYGAQQHAPLLDVDIPISAAFFPAARENLGKKSHPGSALRRKSVFSQSFKDPVVASIAAS